MKIYKALIPMLLIISNNCVLVKQAPNIETIKINIEKNNLSESFKQYDELCIREKDEILKEFKKDIYNKNSFFMARVIPTYAKRRSSSS